MGLIVNPKGRSPTPLGGIVSTEAGSVRCGSGTVLNDVALPTAGVLGVIPIVGATSWTLNGVESDSVTERSLIVFNNSATATGQIAGLAGGSLAANQFNTPVTLGPYQSAQFLWTGATGNWVLVGTSGGGSASPYTLTYYASPVHVDTTGATTTTLFSQSIPGNALGTNKQAIFDAFGRFQASGGASVAVTLNLTFGSAASIITLTTNTIAVLGVFRAFRIKGRVQNLNAANSQALILDYLFTGTQDPTAGYGSYGGVIGQILSTEGNTAADAVSAGSGFANDTTAAQTFQLTAKVNAGSFTGGGDEFTQTYASLVIQ